MKMPVLFLKLMIVFTMATPVIIFAQKNDQYLLDDAPYFFRKQYSKITYSPTINVDKNIREKQDWAALIDSVWGPGQSVEGKLAIFDTYWNNIDWYFACFQDLEINWDSLRVVYRDEILDTVSRGRFAAILTHLSRSLKEAHTNCEDTWVCNGTAANPGVPLLYVGAWGENGHFGAGLTPLEDSTLLIYMSEPDHPLELEPGDIVLGYDGVPWYEIYPQLIAAELPIKGTWWGCSPSAYTHSWLMSAGLNWHLFDTIDIIKYGTKEITHLPTDPLSSYYSDIYCSEQIEVPGISFPNIDGGELCTHGIIEGTQIGYIYVWGWFWDAGDEFYDAVYDLMFNHETIGMIIDFRLNYGGNMFLSNDALELLFNESVYTIGFDKRDDTANHFSMKTAAPTSIYRINGDPATYYDKPIAVLTGPGALSSGDQVALRLKFHPEAMLFGKSTTAAFNAPTELSVGSSNYYCRYAQADAYLDSVPDHYITHDELIVDFNVWHNPDDAAAGIDAVVMAAMEWIDPNVSIDEVYDNRNNELKLISVYPNPSQGSITVEYSTNKPQKIRIEIINNQGVVINEIPVQYINTGSSKAKIDIGNLPPGIYYCVLCGENERLTTSLVVK